jgi:hypothetical protein
MLTSYLVSCPHPSCGWFGSLLPTKNGVPMLSIPGAVVSFHCPQCEGEWHAKVVGDDVKPLPLEEARPALTV